MAMWETDSENTLIVAQKSLPAQPSEIPFRTPSRNSRRSSRKSVSPGPSSPPPEIPAKRRGSKDVSNDESISILDPRRFTPTLHANLVSEILALRRDQEERSKTIENLENDLHNTRGQHEEFEETLQATAKENRSLKRQLALLEGGTSSALSELARGRDEAVETTADLKRRWEVAQKRIRTQEEEAERVQELWQRDRDDWDNDKRKLECRIHVADGRLKSVLDEVAAHQAIQQNGQHHESEAEEAKEAVNGHGSDTGSIRTMSLTNSVRFSTISSLNGVPGAKFSGISLADELDLEDYESQTDYDGRESVISLRHNRNQSRESVYSKTHRRNMSVESFMRPGSVARGRLLANHVLSDRLEGGILEDDESSLTSKPVYVDAGVQYSPAASPILQAVKLSASSVPVSGEEYVSEKAEILDNEVPARELEVEANQRRKRVHASPQIVIDAAINSTAWQSHGDAISSPKSPTRAPPPADNRMKLVSKYTQTDSSTLQSPRRAPPPIPLLIPSIQLHPPSSAPPTPKEHLLPQHSKDVGCQVSIREAVPTRSMSVQTEEIRVDLRMNLLPPHLQPSAVLSSPPSPEPKADDLKRFSPVPGNLPPRNPRRVKSRTSLDKNEASSPSTIRPDSDHIKDAYPGNNDDGLLGNDQCHTRRPHQVSSLFAGLDNVSSDDAEDFADGDLSDNDFRTALSAPGLRAGANRNKKPVIRAAPASVPERAEKFEELHSLTRRKSSMKPTSQHKASTEHDVSEEPILAQRASMMSTRQLDKPLTLVTSSKPSTMRRAALIQSGVAAHQNRSGSPHMADMVKDIPPFPIPIRASSRVLPATNSAFSDGTRSPTWGRSNGGSTRGLYRAGSVRKVRSAAALPSLGRNYRRHDSLSPPPMSPSTEAPESPHLPPMPNNDITSPRFMKDTSSSRYRSHRQQPSSTTAHTINTINTMNTVVTGLTAETNANSSGSSSQATTVVDAIAQTMVGEWMFKYVRRRKSFSVGEANTDGDNASGIRHKRWVWLAPYERAVMWSSKQPTTGSALLGKSGRKLTIQSVLDVKDDNQSPKGVQPLFTRSILILTPARALKFTAVNAERHYVWLTALSFLAHSSQVVPEIVPALLPIPKTTMPDFELARPNPRLRKNPIRDSIRVAKGKPTAVQPVLASTHSQQGSDGTRDAESFYSLRTNPEAADPPVVPRFVERGYSERGSERSFPLPPLAHNRKRSNTGPRIPPPLSFRGFSSSINSPSNTHHGPSSSTAGMSVGTTGSSDIYQSQGSGSGGYTGMTASGRSSVRTSDASNRPGAVVNNFFDAVGTMRMEAFISPMAISGFDDFPDEQDEIDVLAMHRRRSKEIRRQRSRSRNRNSYYSGKPRPSDESYGGSKTAGEEEYGQYNGTNDPFRGF
ncbi:hypothetical protein BJ878DRAFT_37955 [Calycina marina]|uniref:Pleckstrin homology domain-containing protein n=1 Tax=Calycina marina TaxID=1763456 RepID=A0A9P7Z4D5_9HELO|nr:hypothetical protein BJ878DRAFT_37955 [Calycina marina]